MLILSQNFFGISEMLFKTTIPFKALLVVGAIVAFFNFKKHFTIQQFGLFFAIFSFFIITSITNNNSSLFGIIESFVIYGISAFVFSFCRFNELCLYRMCTFFGFVWLGLTLVINKMHIDSTFLFGYKILPLVLSTFLLLTFKTKKIWLLILRCALFITSLFFLITSGSRGPVLCMCIFMFIHFLPALKQWKTAIIYISVLAIFVVLLLNIKPIIISIYNAMPNKFSFIDKTYRLITNENDMSNGRFDLIKQVFTQYKFTDLLLGVGVGGYSSTHPVDVYTHNIILTVLLDFGLIGASFVIFIMIVFFVRLIRQDENIKFLELLFTLSFVTLFFSMDYWKMFTFWLLIYYMLWKYDGVKKCFAAFRRDNEELCLV